MTFSIANLPEPELVEELDFEAIFRELVTEFRARHPDYTALLESDPAIKLLQVFAYRELVLRQRVNDAFKATLLAFARGGDLDNLAAFYGVLRASGEEDLELQARTIERIKGSSTAGGAAWYRFQTLTADNRVADALVSSPEPGQVRIAVLSMESELLLAATGEDLDSLAARYNIARVQSPQETDAVFRVRVRSQLLGQQGEGASSAQLLEIIDDKIQSDEVRVVTDQVQVIAAEIVLANVVANVYLYPDQPASILNGLEQRLRDDFRSQSGLGWDLTPSWLISRLHVQGVQRVELVSPSSVIVANSTTAVALGNIAITMAGYDR